MNYEILKSNEDQSVNFVTPFGKGKLECRYVHRGGDYFIIYVSSHSGCNFSCRFCHLTATGQTTFDQVGFDEYIDQVEQVMEYYNLISTPPLKKVHFNFMARGEPLANNTVINEGERLIAEMNNIASWNNLEGSVRLSTIMPNTIDRSLEEMIGLTGVIPYYSMYSTDEKFRKRWIPKSLPVEESIKLLKEWQLKSHKRVVIHQAFIEDENDSKTNMNNICDIIEKHELRVKMNIVRYNPYSEKYGKETDKNKIDKLYDIFTNRMEQANLLCSGSRIVPRVGFDVKASCGMFV